MFGKKQYRHEGFTLIELMIVVAIVGVLASIAIPQYFLFILKSKRTEGFEITRGIATAEYAYGATYDTFPMALVSLASGFNALDFQALNPKYYLNQNAWACDTICGVIPRTCDSFTAIVSGDLDNDTTDPNDTIVFQHNGDVPGSDPNCPSSFAGFPFDTPFLLISDI